MAAIPARLGRRARLGGVGAPGGVHEVGPSPVELGGECVGAARGHVGQLLGPLGALGLGLGVAAGVAGLGGRLLRVGVGLGGAGGEQRRGSGAAVAVCDCQYTVSNIEAAPNRAALGGLWDAAFGGAADRVRVGPKVGRRLADYPEGWEEVHAAWRAGDMTARAHGTPRLKCATFYHLVADREVSAPE